MEKLPAWLAVGLLVIHGAVSRSSRGQTKAVLPQGMRRLWSSPVPPCPSCQSSVPWQRSSCWKLNSSSVFTDTQGTLRAPRMLQSSMQTHLGLHWAMRYRGVWM